MSIGRVAIGLGKNTRGMVRDFPGVTPGVGIYDATHNVYYVKSKIKLPKP
jgi:hypothetical protein